MSIEEFYYFKRNLAKDLSEHFKSKISDASIMEALYVLHADNQDMETVNDVWDIKIDYSQALTELKMFDFRILEQAIDIDENLIPSDHLYRKKARIKYKGTIWVIHKNDADPFPSNPHAHNLAINQKLDLSNGKCYERKRFIFQFSKKDLLEIRKKASSISGISVPDLTL